MGRPLGEDFLLIVGMFANFGALAGITLLVGKKWDVSFLLIVTSLAVVLFVAIVWMMFCDGIYQKRCARKGEHDFRFLAALHMAPSLLMLTAFVVFAAFKIS